MADAHPIEEQTLPRYHEKQYYPVNIGETLKDQCRIIVRASTFSIYSSSWFRYTSSEQKYTSLKVCINEKNSDTSPVLNEVNMLRRMTKVAQEAEHPGLFLLVLPVTYSKSTRRMAGTNTLLRNRMGLMLPMLLVRSLVHRLFFSVNWLHVSYGVIHTGIVPIVTEKAAPVYESQTPRFELSGVSILHNFRQMRQAEGRINDDWWMPGLYQAPEILLGLPWSYRVDLWSIGVSVSGGFLGAMVLNLTLLVYDQNQYVFSIALAQNIGHLGPSPSEMLQNSPLYSTYFDLDGNWISEPPIPKTTLEDFVTAIPP
ncbi:hypothetical protein BDV12DRAFT_189478 [Aspergillus spectabilis]